MPGMLPVTPSLINHFLIAMPSLRDPNFDRTVTLICQHDEHGALGIVINRVVDLTVADILEQMNITGSSGAHSSTPVHYGGPVHLDRGFVLHEATEPLQWQSTLPVTGRIALTTSRDILEAIACNQGPKDHLVALGYAGWSGGQLEEEIRANAWLSGPADYGIVFNTPVEQRYDAAIRATGVDPSRLTHEAGHA